jgi:hypothetical protein
MQKKLIKIMIGVGPTHTCQDLFRKLGILPIPCVHVLSSMFVVNNFERFQINNSIHKIYTRINAHFVRFEIFTAVTMKNGIFWDVMPRRSCKNRHFGGT